MSKNNTENNETLVDIHNKVSSKELSDLIKTTYKAFHGDSNGNGKNLEACKSKMKAMPIMIWGSPGIGKSTIVKQCADELGIEFIDARLSQLDVCDVRGLPVPDKENNTMEWFVNGMWPRDPNSRGILFLDELSSIDKSLAVAIYELVLDRRLGKLYSMPNGWAIVCAGNKSNDRAVANTMSSALANRFLHVELDADPEAWTLWGQTHNIHPSVLGYIHYQPQDLFTMKGQNLERGWPSPRSWERVSQMCHICSDESVLRKIIYGLIGNGIGVKFMEFKKMSSQFDDILEYMLNPNKEIKIPEKADQKYALVSAMLYHLWRGETKEDENRRVEGFFRICIALTSDFASMAMMSANEGTIDKKGSECASILFKNSMYKEWAAKHGRALKRRCDIKI